ncbi:class I SAM-dependent methyltransferase [Lysobacter soli]|uniref:class I SAM-dependent methyltransferase n=1 Tax=Lysobacter soli TaxID=453783 RepID=UPI0036919D41
MRIEDLSPSLSRNEEGVYVSGETAKVSYSADGHAECYGIEDSSFWFRHRNECIAALLARHPFSGGPLLDLGGGNGYVAQRIQAEGMEVVLLEPGETGARNARKHRHLDHVVCSTIENAAFRPASFGAIGMFDVIEHIADDRDFLERITPLLVPGGRLYLSVPCHQWLWSQADVDAGHFRRHTFDSLERLLEGQFRVDYLTYFFRPLVLPQYLVRALPYRLGIDKKKGVLSTETEHGTDNGFAVRLLRRMLAPEVAAIYSGRQIKYGASGLLVATRR